MEFSTKVIEKMAEIMVNEMENLTAPGDIRGLETELRELLKKVGGEALKRYLEQADEAAPLEKIKLCPCQ